MNVRNSHSHSVCVCARARACVRENCEFLHLCRLTRWSSLFSVICTSSYGDPFLCNLIKPLACISGVGHLSYTFSIIWTFYTQMENSESTAGLTNHPASALEIRISVKGQTWKFAPMQTTTTHLVELTPLIRIRGSYGRLAVELNMSPSWNIV